MRQHHSILLALLSLAFLRAEAVFGQYDTKVYGFFQGSAMFYKSNPSIPTTTTPVVESNNMGITQANVFISKTSENGLTGFVNLEFVNNFSSDRGWGSFNLQEAFVRYDYRDYLTFKGGYFIPQFNSM